MALTPDDQLLIDRLAQRLTDPRIEALERLARQHGWTGGSLAEWVRDNAIAAGLWRTAVETCVKYGFPRDGKSLVTEWLEGQLKEIDALTMLHALLGEHGWRTGPWLEWLRNRLDEPVANPLLLPSAGIVSRMVTSERQCRTAGETILAEVLKLGRHRIHELEERIAQAESYIQTLEGEISGAAELAERLREIADEIHKPSPEADDDR